jgi:NitT/TauT family transport system ATP-binding protein
MPAKGVDVPHGHDIRVSALRLALGDDPPVPVLDGVDFVARAGEATAIIGPSGCGKSTLLDVLAGLATADSGHADPGGPVALMPQGDALMPWLTLRENIAMGARLAGAPAAEAAGRADTAITALGLGGFGDHYPHALSGGMRQRAALARTLAIEPEVLLLDEPFSALDAQTKMVLQQDLAEMLAEQRKTALFITHDLV